MVPAVGLEPTRSLLPGILSPVRLPFRHAGIVSLYPRSPVSVCELCGRGVVPRLRVQKKRATSGDVARLVEAPSGFEPENEGFADLCLTSWLWCHGLRLSRAISIYQKAGDLATDFSKLCALRSFFAGAELLGEGGKFLSVREGRGASDSLARAFFQKFTCGFLAHDGHERAFLAFVQKVVRDLETKP